MQFYLKVEVGDGFPGTGEDIAAELQELVTSQPSEVVSTLDYVLDISAAPDR